MANILEGEDQVYLLRIEGWAGAFDAGEDGSAGDDIGDFGNGYLGRVAGFYGGEGYCGSWSFSGERVLPIMKGVLKILFRGLPHLPWP